MKENCGLAARPQRAKVKSAALASRGPSTTWKQNYSEQASSSQNVKSVNVTVPSLS